jgi:hypothetical protein
MTDQIENTEVEEGEVELDQMSIQQLRKFASFYRITLERTATKEEIVEAIKAKRKDKDFAVPADKNTRPKAGWARIEIHRDPTPGASNRPVYLGLNGYRICVPRGVPVDVPIKMIALLQDARNYQLVENVDEPLNSPKRYTRQHVLSYPFNVLDQVPGPDPRPGYELSKKAHYGPRVKFRDLFGRWPTKAELLEAKKEGFIKLQGGEILPNLPKED